MNIPHLFVVDLQYQVSMTLVFGILTQFDLIGWPLKRLRSLLFWPVWPRAASVGPYLVNYYFVSQMSVDLFCQIHHKSSLLCERLRSTELILTRCAPPLLYSTQVPPHKGPMRGCYPYEIERKKGSYFPILGSIVVINQAIEFLETYGLLRN